MNANSAHATKKKALATFDCSAVAVVAVATIHVAFWQPWRVAGISTLLGGVTSPGVGLTDAFRVDLAASISTGRACYGRPVVVAFFPRFGAKALVALQCIGYKKKTHKKTERETYDGTPRLTTCSPSSPPLSPALPRYQIQISRLTAPSYASFLVVAVRQFTKSLVRSATFRDLWRRTPGVIRRILLAEGGTRSSKRFMGSKWRA